MLSWGRGAVVVRLLPSSVPGGFAPGFSHLGVVPDDAAGRRAFSGISRFPCSCIPALLHAHLTLHSSALKISILIAALISPLYIVTLISNLGSHLVPEAQLLASHQYEPGSIPVGVAPRFSHEEIVLDNDTSRGSPVPPSFTFRRCSTPGFTPIDFQQLDVQSHIYLASALNQLAKTIWIFVALQYERMDYVPRLFVKLPIETTALNHILENYVSKRPQNYRTVGASFRKFPVHLYLRHYLKLSSLAFNATERSQTWLPRPAREVVIFPSFWKGDILWVAWQTAEETGKRNFLSFIHACALIPAIMQTATSPACLLRYGTSTSIWNYNGVVLSPMLAKREPKEHPARCSRRDLKSEDTLESTTRQRGEQHVWPD
ncbi:hypothetical protein PR048_018866 [Dryococelus australis]|uniref:Uncharacterized protein n=1 Tax=Dryococelus australis TaxID=614101 RepID=A0ABQ9H206_9NEOP|nr:hypothetical protein PR048_018866 [Dryococelus australis]